MFVCCYDAAAITPLEARDTRYYIRARPRTSAVTNMALDEPHIAAAPLRTRVIIIIMRRYI